MDPMIARRGLNAGVALACAGLGVLLAAAHVPADEPRRFLPALVAWFAMAFALALEPPQGARRRWTALAALGAALVGAVIALVIATRQEPPWWRPGPYVWPPGTRLACAAWTGGVPLPTLLLALAALPAPLGLLIMRRVGRQLEWQAAAAALGPPVVGVALFPELAAPGRLWVLALSGLPVGLGAYLVDRAQLGEQGVARYPGPDGVDEAALTRRRRGLLAGLVMAGAVWALVAGRVVAAVTPSAVEPGFPDMAVVLDDVRARQETYRAEHGEYARVLGQLEGIERDLAGGYVHGYVVRYGRFDARTWAIAADPVPAKMGWRSYRLVVPGSALEVADGPFPLERPER